MSSYLICKEDLIFLISMPERRLYFRCPESYLFEESLSSDRYFEYIIGDKDEVLDYLKNHMVKKPSVSKRDCGNGTKHSLLTVETMREILLSLNKACVLYTGAGISRAAGIFTQEEFISFMYLDRLPEFYDLLIKCPNILFSRYQMFASMLSGMCPTRAHNSIKMLCEHSGAKLVSENLDRLHEKTGIIPHNPFSEEELYHWRPERVILLGVGAPQCVNLLYSWVSHGARCDILNIADPQIPYFDYQLCLADVQDFFCEMAL